MQEPITFTLEGCPIWPFPFVNGQQTDQSRALELDKQAHKPAQFDISTIEDALL